MTVALVQADPCAYAARCAFEQGRPCTEIATQLQAVERAVMAGKRTLIHDHIDHCLGDGGASELAEMRALTKLL